MTDVADILRAAADLLEPEGAWTQHATARDGSGRIVHPERPDARSWCVAGAIRKVGGGGTVADQTLDCLSQYLGDHGIDYWNDTQPGPEPVLAALRAAAEAAS